MFPPGMWFPDTFSHFQSASSLSPSPIPLYGFTCTTNDAYPDLRTHRSNRHRHQAPRKAQTHMTPETSETDSDTYDDIKFPFSKYNHHPHPLPDFNHFSRTTLRLPPHSSHTLRPHQILILPPTLLNLKIRLHGKSHKDYRTVCAAVAADMRLRDVLKQLLQQEYLCDAKVYVKTPREWRELENSTRMSELGRGAGEERSEVELRIVVGDRARREREDVEWEREMRRESRYGWEKEVGVGRVERMRMF